MRRSGPPSTSSRYRSPATRPGFRVELMCPPWWVTLAPSSLGSTVRGGGHSTPAAGSMLPRHPGRKCTRLDPPGTTRGHAFGIRPACGARYRARHRALAERPREAVAFVMAVVEAEVHLEPEGIMKRILTASAAAAFALAVSVPAFAGGGHCSGGDASASASSCEGHSAKSAAWAGAWLERTASGTVTVAEVAKGSPAAKAGLKSGDVVLAVNGYDLSDSEARAECASKASCKVGSTVTYAVQR